ncbi:MAG: FtsQ-type POTRA domain-containing protein [bacterium]|nr:FtsQ-type POTRA domain-containing protein [bacterium]
MRKEFRKLKKIKKKQSFLKNRFFLFGVAVAVCAELLLYGIVLLPFIQIQEVRIKGNESVSENNINSVVLDRLWGKFLFFPTASILLVDTLGIRNALLEAIPELESVNIQRKFPNILTVVVRERGVVALFCQKLHCVAIDNEGVAFKEAEPSPESIVIYGQGQSLNLREAVVKKDVLYVILEFAREAEHRSLFMQGESSFEIVSETQIHARTKEGWSVYFTNTEDLSWQITKLQTVLENKIPPEKRRRLEYIDVRFGDQAYFKYR